MKRRKYITSGGSPVVGVDIIFMHARASFAYGGTGEYGDAGGHVSDRQDRISCALTPNLTRVPTRGGVITLCHIRRGP